MRSLWGPLVLCVVILRMCFLACLINIQYLFLIVCGSCLTIATWEMTIAHKIIITSEMLSIVGERKQPGAINRLHHPVILQYPIYIRTSSAKPYSLY